MELEIPEQANWLETKTLSPEAFECGYCGHEVSSEKGYSLARGRSANVVGVVRICPHCNAPSFFAPSGLVVPGVPFGESVSDAPDEITELYEEARRCAAHNCHTAAVLLCRKILVHLGVELEAEHGQSIPHYIDHIAEAGYVPPSGQEWVDRIRDQNIEAPHEIVVKAPEDAKDLITFVEMLLKFIYEFPNRLPAAG